MVTLTEDAEIAIRQLIATAETPEATCMRLATADEEGQPIQLALAAGPEEGDQRAEGARVPFYVESAVAESLDGRALDADIDAEAGTVSFTLVEA